MNLSINFGDGKPFFRTGITAEQLGYELMHWSRNYKLTFVWMSGETLFIEAKEKGEEQ